ncbi:MAG: hypothetical protein ACT4N1_06005 [Nitrososphaerota archaeon]
MPKIQLFATLFLSIILVGSVSLPTSFAQLPPPGDPCDGIDNNGNGRVDEGALGVDDNGNGTIDEPSDGC